MIVAIFSRALLLFLFLDFVGYYFWLWTCVVPVALILRIHGRAITTTVAAVFLPPTETKSWHRMVVITAHFARKSLAVIFPLPANYCCCCLITLGHHHHHHWQTTEDRVRLHGYFLVLLLWLSLLLKNLNFKTVWDFSLILKATPMVTQAHSSRWLCLSLVSTFALFYCALVVAPLIFNGSQWSVSGQWGVFYYVCLVQTESSGGIFFVLTKAA